MLDVHAAGGPGAWYGVPPARLPERYAALYDEVEGAIERLTAEVKASPGHAAARKEAERVSKR